MGRLGLVKWLIVATSLGPWALPPSVNAVAEPKDDRGLIQGIVTYEDRNLVKGATVYAVPLGRPMGAIVPHADTDETGHFVIYIPRSWFGKFAVAAKKEDEDYPDMSNQFYSDGKFETITLTSSHPAKTVIIRLGPKAGVLLGTVADAVSNAPLSPCVEFRRASEPNNFLSGSGLVKPQYKLLIPADTDILVKISLDGYKTWYYPGTVEHTAAKPVQVGPGEKKTVDIRLEPDAQVKTGCPTPLIWLVAKPDKWVLEVFLSHGDKINAVRIANFFSANY
jgi:hypothetical protein